VVLTGRRTLNVFDVASATRVLERRLPALAAPAISVSFGIAVLSSGDRVYALRLSDGRLATIARAPAAVTARIGDAGIAYAWSSGGRGTVMFVPLRAVQSALAGSSRTAAEG
jgi:hypothetical protein